MNTKITKIMSVLAAVAIVASSFVFTMPVAASTPGDGQFTIQDIPSATKNILFPGGSVLDMAVASDGNTVYVVTNLGGSLVMKTTDAGQSFEAIQNNLLTIAPGFAPTQIAVAPDDNNTIAVSGVIAGAPAVAISKDGGTTWATLPAPPAGAVVTDIDVAPARSGTLLGREYVISTADPATATVGGGARTIQATVTAAPWSATAGIYRINYLDQGGNPSLSAAFTIPANSVAGTLVAITLETGDTGVIDVTGPVVVNTPATAPDTFTIDAVGAPAVLFGTVTNGLAGAYADGAANTSPTMFGNVMIIGNTATWASVAAGIPGSRDYMAVQVTPNFLGDRAVIAVGSSAGFPTVVIVNTATSTVIVAATIPAGTTIGYDGAMVLANSIISASITLPTNFDPTTTSGRRSYIGIASVLPTTDNGVYRVDDNTARDLGAVTGAPISSVAYSGTVDSGILFAALRNNNGNDATDIKYTTGMTATSPTWTTTLKGPSGDAASPNAQIAVASDYATTSRVFAATQGVESAFSVSNDAGVSFNGESLVNHGLGDPSLSFAGTNNVFLTETNAGTGYGSIWQSEVPFSSTSWKRIFNKIVNGPAGRTFALSTNPAYSTTPAMFLYEGTTVNAPIYVTQDGGVSWTTRNGPTGVGRQTNATRDAQTVYYVDTTGNVYKSTNAAWTWSTGVNGGAGIIRSITTGSANELIVGGTTGVAISTDDGASFTAFTTPVGGAGARFSVAKDTAYATNHIIYVVDTFNAGQPVSRIDASSTNNAWTQFTIPWAATPIGITTRSGILYVTTNDFTAAGGVYRTLYPTDLIGNQNWQNIAQGLSAATGAPAAGVTTTAGINLYVRGAVTNAIYAFNDFLASTKPTLTTPADNYNDAINPANGAGYAIDLKVQPMGTGNGQVNAFDIEIVDKDNGFTGTATAAAVAVAPTNPIINTAGIVVLQPNKVYQWRMRASSVASGVTLDSPWSDARTINVQSGSIVNQPYVGPIIQGPVGSSAVGVDPNNVGIAWAPVSGATEYQVIVATDAALTKTVGGTPATTTIPAYQVTGLTEGTTYFFAVKATKPTESVQTVGTFSTRTRATTPQPTTTGPAVQPTIVVQAPEQATPAYIWAVIAIGAILVIAVIILIVRTRRVP